MKSRSAQIGLGALRKQRETTHGALPPVGVLFFAVTLAFVSFAAPAFGRQPDTAQTSIPHAKCVIGLENIKPNTKGTLTLVPAGLEFATGKNKVKISTTSIQDIFTGQESRQNVSGPGGTLAKSAIPYGGGRVVSLFSHKVEVLTVEYLDSNGGFHGTIFVLSPGKATILRTQLVAQGAKTTAHAEPPAPQGQKQ